MKKRSKIIAFLIVVFLAIGVYEFFEVWLETKLAKEQRLEELVHPMLYKKNDLFLSLERDRYPYKNILRFTLHNQKNTNVAFTIENLEIDGVSLDVAVYSEIEPRTYFAKIGDEESSEITPDTVDNLGLDSIAKNFSEITDDMSVTEVIFQDPLRDDKLISKEDNITFDFKIFEINPDITRLDQISQDSIKEIVSQSVTLDKIE